MTSTSERFGDEFGAERMWGLKELTMPDAVSVLPLAPGWYALMALVGLFALYVGWRVWQRWRRNAYRREALARLDAEGPAGLPFVLRRAALMGFARYDVASLRGSAWIGWLNRTGRDHLFEAGDAALLDTLAYGDVRSVAADELERLVRISRTWLKTHVHL